MRDNKCGYRVQQHCNLNTIYLRSYSKQSWSLPIIEATKGSINSFYCFNATWKHTGK